MTILPTKIENINIDICIFVLGKMTNNDLISVIILAGQIFFWLRISHLQTKSKNYGRSCLKF